jgi:acyl-CoA synthetase (NDP forming)
MTGIRYLFEPQSIAVIGASHDTGKIGYRVLENIVLSGYPRKVYPINPRGGRVFVRQFRQRSFP